jgi:spermidine synthase
MLTTFLLGSGLGSYLMGFLLRLQKDASPARDARWLALLVILTAFANLGSYHLISVLDRVVPRNIEPSGWAAFLSVAFLQAAIFVLPSVMLLGALFSLLAHSLEQQGLSDSRSAADLFAVNSGGGVLGALLTTFVFLELLGVQNTLRLLCATLAFIGLMLVLRRWKKERLVVGLALTVVGVVVGMGFSKDVLRAKFADLLGEILFYKESSQDITIVHRMAGIPDVRLAYHDARGTGSTRFAENEVARLLAHTSMAMNPRAKHILVISFGCGNTASAFAKYPVDSIDIVDISRSVQEASAYFWTNQGVARDPRVKFHVEDGRNYLLRTQKRYDVIELELPNLLLDSVVYLYTQEFYALAKSRLNPGGVVSQWINYLKTGRETSLSLIHTMTTVFPNSALFSRRWAWWVNGRREDSAPLVTYETAREALDQPEVRKDLAAIGMTFERVLGTLLAAGPPLRDVVEGSPVITDDWTMADDTAPKYWLGHVTPLGKVPIPQFFPADLAPGYRSAARLHALQGFPAELLDRLPDTATEFSDNFFRLADMPEQ